MKRGLALLLLFATGTGFAAEDDTPAPIAERSVLERGREAMERGIDFLIASQNADGSWGHHAQKRPYKIFAPVPGAHRSFRLATSALAMMALRRSPRKGAAIESARKKGLAYLVTTPRTKRSHGRDLYSIWEYGYRLQCLADCLLAPREGDDPVAIRRRMKDLIGGLARYQTVDGGWCYLEFLAKTARPSDDSASFYTAMVLLALDRARKAGVTAPEPMVRKAVRSLARCRTREGTYVYSFNWRRNPRGGINRPAGSLSRTPGNDLALHLFGEDIGREDLRKGVRNLVSMRKFARMALRRPVPHESWFQVSAYFYLFGYYYAAEVLDRLPREDLEPLRDKLIEEVVYTQGPDGAFWDFPLYGYHKPYGTGYAVMALQVFTR